MSRQPPVPAAARQVVMGIDPGVTGHLVVLGRQDGGEQYPAILWAEPPPIVELLIGRNKTPRRRYDVGGLLRQMRMVSDLLAPTLVVLEEAHGRGNQVGGAQLSYGLGLIRMACEAAGLRVMYVSPATWKRDMRCPASKRSAARLARSLIAHDPAAGDPFAGPRGGTQDGKAEAALLALWGMMGGNPVGDRDPGR